MPEYQLNDEGHLLDAEGKPVMVGDEPAVVKGALAQKQVDRVIQERLARQTERIKALEAQANRTPELERLLEGLKAEKGELEQQLVQVRETAKAESEAQLAKLKREADSYKERYEREAADRVRDQVSTAILSAAKDRFNDPGIDVVPHLLGVHKREEEKGPDGKPTGRSLDYFRVRVKNDKGEELEDFVPVDKALDAWATAHPHHVRANNAGGTGQSRYGAANTNVKRSEMSDAQKAAFVGEHGFEAFTKLPS